MKKYFIKSIAMIMMLAMVLSCVAVTASAANIVTYSGTCGTLFSCNLKGDIEGATGSYRAMAKTTRKTDANEYIYVKAYIEYTDGEWEQDWDVAASLHSVTVLIESPVSIRTACGVSSYHKMYNEEPGEDGPIQVIVGSKRLGYRS